MAVLTVAALGNEFSCPVQIQSGVKVRTDIPRFTSHARVDRRIHHKKQIIPSVRGPSSYANLCFSFAALRNLQSMYVRASVVAEVAARIGKDDATTADKTAVCEVFQGLMKAMSWSTFALRSPSFSPEGLRVLHESMKDQVHKTIDSASFQSVAWGRGQLKEDWGTVRRVRHSSTPESAGETKQEGGRIARIRRIMRELRAAIEQPCNTTTFSSARPVHNSESRACFAARSKARVSLSAPPTALRKTGEADGPRHGPHIRHNPQGASLREEHPRQR